MESVSKFIGHGGRYTLLAALVLVALLSSHPAPASAKPAASPLASWYANKYPAWQRALAASGVEKVFAHASPADRRQAVLETLAFFHVVYHPTRSHDIHNNIGLVHAYRDEIGLACERFGVPPAMAYAILTWENSGSTAATSYAACVGMGQLSDGAMHQAHRVAERFARVDTVAQAFCTTVADLVGDVAGENPLTRALRTRASFLAQRARELDFDRLHARLARASGQKDERAVPRANIEDSVVFMRYLLEMFGNRPDIAISAYHNGVGNTDDLLRDYLRRIDPRNAGFTLTNRAPLLTALKKHNISYVTLWNDVRCHQMLNGLRTMDGDITTPYNAREAMGDESDIYVWKTLAAYAGTVASREQVSTLVERYRMEQGEAETVGFEAGNSLVTERGLRATREVVGYLVSLEQRMATSARARVPLLVTASHVSDAHRKGLAFDITVNSDQLARILNEDWLFDRIYKTRLSDGRLHICLNPRYGEEFLSRYHAARRSSSSSASASR